MMRYRWAGVNRSGGAASGVMDASPAELPAIVRARFDQGWKSLRVAAGEGPVPPPLGADLAAAIDRHADTGRRQWWAAGVCDCGEVCDCGTSMVHCHHGAPR